MTHRFAPEILREYDVRGRVGRNLSDADAHALGRGFATAVREAGGRRVAVGYDGRLTSPALEAALVAGLTASGVDVVRIGLCPTPMLYFAEATLEVDGGIQVTGSHNPPGDNGFKLVQQHRSFFGEAIQRLAARAAAGDWADGDRAGGAGTVTTTDVTEPYVARLLAGHSGGACRIAWDCGNGASGPVVERLTKLLPGEHHLLFTDVDGHFPHHHPDPTIEANLADLKRVVAANKLHFGVAFDGDGDRIGVVDADGRMIRADQLLAILAEPVLAGHPHATIVADVKASQALFDRIAALGGTPVMWKTGHSLMKEKIHDTGAPIGGEMSGHIFFGDELNGADDAHYAAIRLIAALDRAGAPLGDLVDRLPRYCNTPDIRIPVPEDRKLAIVADIHDRLKAEGATIDTTDGIRVTTDEGWWLLRASNTEAAVTLRAEAADEAGLARTMGDIEARLGAVGVQAS
jgi:phosphomannomutase